MSEERAKREAREHAAERLSSGKFAREFDAWMQRQGYSEEQRREELRQMRETAENLRREGER